VRVYVASSWKTANQPEVVAALREAGHEVYDFRHPSEGHAGFSWSDVGLASGPMTAADAVQTLKDPRCETGFSLDMNALRSCDMCVLLQPSGRSAHLELGWAAGAGKWTVVFLQDNEPPDLMYKVTNILVTSMEELLKAVGYAESFDAYVTTREFWQPTDVR
jgi:hypothetical protein